MLARVLPGRFGSLVCSRTAKDTLFLDSFMFIPGETGRPLEAGRPSCTPIIDAIDGEMPHIAQQINFAVVAKAPIERFRAHAQMRRWQNARLDSSSDTTYNHDHETEGPDESQYRAPPSSSPEFERRLQNRR